MKGEQEKGGGSEGGCVPLTQEETRSFATIVRAAQYLEDISKFNRVIPDQASRKQCIRASVDSYMHDSYEGNGAKGFRAQQRDSVFLFSPRIFI